MLLVAAETVAALPGLGEVGGLLTVLLASLKSSEQKSYGHSKIQQQKRVCTGILLSIPNNLSHISLFF